MQDRKLPVTQLGYPSSKFKKAQRPHNKKRKTKSCKILGLLASIGATLSLTQPAEAKATIVNDKGETTIAELPSLDSSPKKAQSVALKNLGSIESQSSTISIKTDKKRSPVTKIPQLPALEVAQSQPPAERIHTVREGETIAQIARAYGVFAKQIIEANQLSNPNFISINRQLVIPNSQLASDRYSNNTKSEATLAQGGASPVADSTKPLSSLAEQKAQFRDQKTTTDNIGGARQLTNNDLSDGDSYISKLRESIVELRTRYQNQSGSRDLTVTNAATVDDGVTNTVLNATPLNSPSEAEAANKALNSTSPSTSAENNSLISLSGADTVTPALPPLASPEEYLPDNPLFDGYMWPAKGTLTSGYGWRWGRMHKGIDIAAPVGTPIMAAASGEVVFAGWNSGGYGNLVKLQHSDGSVTFYAHNHRVLVGKGQKVRQGQLIAEMGSTGRSTGPHLHFEIRPNGTTAINPIAHLPKN